MNLSYELRRNGRRPGPVELWERFDAAVGELGAALEGVALSAIARAFINLADIAHTLADEIESIHSSLSGSRPTVRDVAKKYKAVRRALVDAGWSVVRQQGSHEVWAHPDRDERIVVAGKDSDTVPVGTLGSIRRASGLEHLR
jgi:predicted RNA binding protein YcfA (HicA-like mRNA interferase family)